MKEDGQKGGSCAYCFKAMDWWDDHACDVELASGNAKNQKQEIRDILTLWEYIKQMEDNNAS